MSPPPSLHSSIHLYHANLRQTGWFVCYPLKSAAERTRSLSNETLVVSSLVMQCFGPWWATLPASRHASSHSEENLG
jgi:hypothetical protein